MPTAESDSAALLEAAQNEQVLEIELGNHDIVVDPPKVSPNTSRAKRYNYKLSAKDDELILKNIEEHKPLGVIAKKIGCCRDRLAEYIHKHPILQRAFTVAKDEIDDLAEVRLFDKINKGDLQALMFYMPRQMRHRGYGDEPVDENKGPDSRIVIGGEIQKSDIEMADAIMKQAAAETQAALDKIPELKKQGGGSAAVEGDGTIPGSTPVEEQQPQDGAGEPPVDQGVDDEFVPPDDERVEIID